MPFSQNLSKMRKEKGLTQEDMAKKAGVGIAQVRRYEAGKSSPTLDVIKNLVLVLGVSADELIFDEGESAATSRIPDKKLLEQFEMITKLKPHDQDAIKTVLESIIIKNRLEEVMSPASEALWTKEMRKAVNELREGAKNYSDEEIDDIVDEAVAAVRKGKGHARH